MKENKRFAIKHLKESLDNGLTAKIKANVTCESFGILKRDGKNYIGRYGNGLICVKATLKNLTDIINNIFYYKRCYFDGSFAYKLEK